MFESYLGECLFVFDVVGCLFGYVVKIDFVLMFCDCFVIS